MEKNLFVLPEGLPTPEDDGACDHLQGMKLPALPLTSTADTAVNLAQRAGTSVIFVYPMTGQPERPPMRGWTKIPGARGCTPQCVAFRDRYEDFQKEEVEIFGVSAQPLAEQKEAIVRLHLPYLLLNDSDLAWGQALKLPTFEYDAGRYIKRLTLVVEDGVIQQVYYPVFPPHLNPTDILAQFKTERVS